MNHHIIISYRGKCHIFDEYFDEICDMKNNCKSVFLKINFYDNLSYQECTMHCGSIIKTPYKSYITRLSQK